MNIKNLCVALLVIFSAITSNASPKHLFILSGQSNMKRLDPDISFTPSVEKEFGEENVIVVHSAQGGTPISAWDEEWKSSTGEPGSGVGVKAPGKQYELLIGKVKNASQGATIASVTFIWMQGESDANGTSAPVYADSLARVIEKLKSDLETKELNIVIGRISDFGLKRPEWLAIRKAQEGIAAKYNGEWIDTDDLNDGIFSEKKKRIVDNDLHYSADGYKIFGERCAACANQLIKKK